MNGEEFVRRLDEEMQALFDQLGERQTLEAESGGRLEVPALLRLALASELEAAELAGSWLPSTPEVDVKALLAQQCHDEMRHYQLIAGRLAELGDDVTEFDPVADGYSPLYRYLQGLDTTVERVAAGPYAGEAVAEVRNAQFIAFCHSVGDAETAKLYEEIVHPEEIHHHRRGREILEKYATTPEIQAKVTTAVRSSLAIADELQSLTEKMTGLHTIPVS